MSSRSFALDAPRVEQRRLFISWPGQPRRPSLRRLEASGISIISFLIRVLRTEMRDGEIVGNWVGAYQQPASRASWPRPPPWPWPSRCRSCRGTFSTDGTILVSVGSWSGTPREMAQNEMRTEAPSFFWAASRALSRWFPRDMLTRRMGALRAISAVLKQGTTCARRLRAVRCAVLLRTRAAWAGGPREDFDGQEGCLRICRVPCLRGCAHGGPFWALRQVGLSSGGVGCQAPSTGPTSEPINVWFLSCLNAALSCRRQGSYHPAARWEARRK